MTDLIQFNVVRATDSDNAPLSGAKAYFYESGTSTPATVYSDSGLTTAHASPLVADANGVFDEVFYSGGQLKVNIVDSADAQVSGYPIDPAPFSSATTSAASDISSTPFGSVSATNVQDALEAIGTSSLLPANNLSDVDSVATSQRNLNLEPGVDVQAYSAALDAVTGTNTGDEVAATDSAAGIVELATTAEGTTGTATDKIPAVDVVKSMIDTHAGGGWEEIATEEPTTDVSNTTPVTGLSGQGWKRLRGFAALQLTNGTANLVLQIRSSAGTWRDLATTISTSGNNDAVACVFEIENFNDQAGTDFLVCHMKSGTAASSIDRSTNDVDLGMGNTSGRLVWRTDDWDELRLDCSAGNIEGSTANERGIFYLEGMK